MDNGEHFVDGNDSVKIANCKPQLKSNCQKPTFGMAEELASVNEASITPKKTTDSTPEDQELIDEILASIIGVDYKGTKNTSDVTVSQQNGTENQLKPLPGTTETDNPKPYVFNLADLVYDDEEEPTPARVYYPCDSWFSLVDTDSRPYFIDVNSDDSVESASSAQEFKPKYGKPTSAVEMIGKSPSTESEPSISPIESSDATPGNCLIIDSSAESIGNKKSLENTSDDNNNTEQNSGSVKPFNGTENYCTPGKYLKYPTSSTESNNCIPGTTDKYVKSINNKSGLENTWNDNTIGNDNEEAEEHGTGKTSSVSPPNGTGDQYSPEKLPTRIWVATDPETEEKNLNGIVGAKQQNDTEYHLKSLALVRKIRIIESKPLENQG